MISMEILDNWLVLLEEISKQVERELGNEWFRFMKLFMKWYGRVWDAEQEDGMGEMNDVNVSEMDTHEFAGEKEKVWTENFIWLFQNDGWYAII